VRSARPGPVGLRPVDGERVLHEDHGVVHVGGAELAEAVVGEGAVRVGGEVGARTVVVRAARCGVPISIQFVDTSRVASDRCLSSPTIR
jgi:hypothetical protein